MALQSAYKQFLSAPNPTFLASDASINYITTLTTVNGTDEIIKHLNKQAKQIKKKEEKFLSAIESQDALAVEVETTMEFVTSGGAYLPGLDDNFLTDRTVTFPIIHIVSFDKDGKIQQVRQNWDQGSLLKLIDVIGKTGRNWPIRDGKDQIKLIISSAKLGTGDQPIASKGTAEVKKSNGNGNINGDPHASLSLFAPREQEDVQSAPAAVATRASARPPPRDLNDILASEDAPVVSPPKGRGPDRSLSPVRNAKGGAAAGKNYQPSRLFDHDDVDSPIRPAAKNTDSFYRPNPAKYAHFDFGDGSDPQDTPKPAPATKVKTKGASSWNFDDFNTPEKPVPGKGVRGQDIRHWGTSDDEVLDSPIKQKKVDKPRKDSEPHFEFIDDGTPEGKRIVGRPRGAGGNSGMGLYQNNLYSEDDEETQTNEPRVLGNVTNVNVRRKDFDPHFQMTDEPTPAKKQENHLSEDKKKVLKMMDANWAAYDESPTTGTHKENYAAPTSPSRTKSIAGVENINHLTEKERGITIAGDGMGNRRGTVAGDKKDKSINIGGDGMGGRKGAGRSWGFGDDSDGEEEGGQNELKKKGQSNPGRRLGGEANGGGGNFWDF